MQSLLKELLILITTYSNFTIMSPIRKGSIGINPILLRCSLPAINDGVSFKYLARYGKSLTLSFRAGVKAKKQNLGVLTPFWNELYIV